MVDVVAAMLVLLLVGAMAAATSGIIALVQYVRRRRHPAPFGLRPAPALPPASPVSPEPMPTTAPTAAEWRTAERGRSIDVVARDLRRLRLIIARDKGDSALHQIAHRMAYDRLLVEACVLMRVPHGLVGEDVQSLDRDCERLLTEANLQDRGLRVTNELGRL